LTYFKPLLYDEFDNIYLSYQSLTPVLEEARQSTRVINSHSRTLYEVMARLSRAVTDQCYELLRNKIC